MFLGLAVFAAIAVIATVLALRLIRALFRLLTSEKQEKQEQKGKASTQETSPKQSASEKESQIEQSDKKTEMEVPEETRGRYAASLFNGISESFSTDETSFRIDEKALADKCVSESPLSYLEYNNRELAGKDYLGFNLIVEQDSRMVLTYGGSAVVSITKVEVESTAVINGEVVKGTAPGYRINTFPPELKDGMTVGDLEQMLDAAEHIKALSGNPALVSDAMVGYLARPDNAAKLKGSIDRKIQSKESVKKNRELSTKHSHREPKNLSPRPS